MGLLKTATVEQAAAKVGIYGPQGSGKTTTAALIAIGLSKTYHGGAAVAFMDTENGSDYLVPLFEMEGVKLMNFKSRAFKDMCAGIKEAQEAGACAYLVDSYTHPWQELNDALKAKLRVNRLEFRHMDQLKTMWRGWTDLMLNSPLHVVVSGRLGYVWDHEINDEGKKDLVKLGTKMKSESEAGYEPSLLIEMEGVQSDEGRQKQGRAKKGSIVHHAYILKDRWRSLNGRTFTFKDINSYKAGDYKKVFDAFNPHFAQLAIGKVEQRSLDVGRTSGALFDGAGDSAYQQRARRVQIVLEEIQGAFTALWPGQTAHEKEQKRLAVETLFGTRSWTAVEAMPLERLDAALDALKLFEERTHEGRGAALTDTAEATTLFRQCMAVGVEAERQALEGAVL